MSAKKRPLKLSTQGGLSGHTRAAENARQGLEYSDVRQRLSKRYWFLQSGAAKGSEFLKHFASLLAANPNLRVVLYLRVSTGDQYRNLNLLKQEQWLRRELGKLGIPILAVFHDECSGWHSHLAGREAAIECARRFGAIVLAESADRFLRSELFTTREQWRQPTRAEWERLQEQANGVTLATFLHPDTPWRSVRSHQTARAENLKCEAGEMKQRRTEKLSRVIELWAKWGCSYREIEAETGVRWSTVRDWIKRAA